MSPEQKQKRLERLGDAAAWAGEGLILLLGVGFVILCFRMAPTPDDVSLNFAILGASVVFGWLAGMLFTPSTSREEGQFGVAAKAISTFASGYLLAKIDNILNALLTPKMLLESSSLLPAFRLTLSLAAFVGMFLHIYILRVYILHAVPDFKGPNGVDNQNQTPPNGQK